MQTLQVQQTLQTLGLDPGPLDGIFGRKTSSALERFQRRQGLLVTGLADEATRQAFVSLAGAQPDRSALIWMEEARRLMGLKEVSGNGSNSRILDWAKELDIHYPNDDVPWCGLFVAHCVAVTLTSEPLPSNPLGARNWLKFGEEAEPKLGAVLVFWRGSKAGWMGHVGFYDGEDGTNFYVLAGNQSNSVSVARISKKRLLGARWPAKAKAISSTRYTRQNAGEDQSDDEA